MKKLLTLVLALAMTLSLAACGGGGEDTADEGSEGSTSGEPTKMTLILRGGAYGESLEASLAPFEAEHNVDIEVMLMSFDDLHTGIALDAVNEVGTYDLCMVDGSWMAEFTENGVLANLSEMGYSFDDDIIPATTTICKVGEDIYLAPYYGNVTVMMYNKQLLADAGYAPEDIDSFADLMDIAQKTKAADSNKNGFLIRGGSADNILSDFLPHLVVHGGWVVDENNNPTVDTPEFKAAMQEYLDLYALGSTLDKDDIVASVTSGETALAQIWPGWYTPTADGPANYTTIPTKLTDDSAPVDAVALQGVWCIGIPDNAPHKDLALELLEYVMSPEVQLASIENNGVPCRYSCLTDSTVLETYPHLQTVCGALETGVYRPVIEEWTEFTNILGTEMDNIIQGTKTMDEALAYDVVKTKELGYNMIRKHVKVEPARWYYHCDKTGIIVWQDMPSGDITPGSPRWQMNRYFTGEEKRRSPESEACYRKEWREIIDCLRPFVSIGVWVPFNETWGQFKTPEIAAWTKAYDPTRLVDAASGGNHYRAGDMLDQHNYPMPALLLFDTDRVSVLGEFGGIGQVVEGHLWEKDRNWGYVRFNSPREVTDEYEKYAEELLRHLRYFSAAVYTQTSDVETEVNGLMTYDRKVMKVEPERIREINRKVCNALNE